jgi:hypothetical protein
VSEKKSGCGAVKPISRGCGAVVGTTPDRHADGVPEQRNGLLCAVPIMEDAAHAELRMVLNGESIPTRFGFDVITEQRRMWIPFHRTECPAEALRIAKTEGIVSAKLEAMPELAAAVLLATHLSREPLDN